VRNLLHDEVTQRGSAELAARWSRLIENEVAFRTPRGMDDIHSLVAAAT
jgi:hypothetical protein